MEYENRRQIDSKDLKDDTNRREYDADCYRTRQAEIRKSSEPGWGHLKGFDD